MTVSLIKKYAEITATRQAEIRDAKLAASKLPSSPEDLNEDHISESLEQRAWEDFSSPDATQTDGDET